MQRTKKQLREEIARLQELLDVLHRRRHISNLQAAKAGVNIEPKILFDIDDATKQIKLYEVEISKLETQVAEDQFTLAEAEYRALLAEVWEQGKPTTIGSARLELARLHLGLLPPRAQELEQQTRSAIANETLLRLSKEGIRRLFPANGLSGKLPDHDHYTQQFTGMFDEPIVIEKDTGLSVMLDTLRLIGRAIRLDHNLTATILAGHIRYAAYNYSPPASLDFAGIKDLLLQHNDVWPYFTEYHIFEYVIGQLQNELLDDTKPESTPETVA